MQIINNHNGDIIKPFEIDGMPDFIVLTGENGSGKTQLLNLLNDSFNNSVYKSNNQGSIVNCENPDISVFDDGKIINQISYFPAYSFSTYINTGYPLTIENINRQWSHIQFKYISFLNVIRLKGNNSINYITINDINHQYTLDMNSRDQLNISEREYKLIKTIYDSKKDKSSPAKLEEIVIYDPIIYDGISNNLFSTNLNLLQLKYKFKKDLGIEPGESPLVTFNKILETAEFNYRVVVPEYSIYDNVTTIQLKDINNGRFVAPDKLSSGEKTIMSLVLALYNSETIQMPQLLLLDEPDASLHPKMSKQMLEVLFEVFVKDKKCKVIITTHSPTTVALADPLWIYQMDRKFGKIIKVSKEDAIKNLTYGLENLTINYEFKKTVFVESHLDQKFYENIYNPLKRNYILENNRFLTFVTISTNSEKGDVNGGCTVVKKIITSLKSNDLVHGLIDWDLKNKIDSKISILGNNNRYAIENYILDPIFICLTLLKEFPNTKKDIGFYEFENYPDVKTLKNDRLQEILNIFIKHYELDDDDKIEYKNILGFNFKIPKYWTLMKGHDLERLLIYKIKPLQWFFDKKNKGKQNSFNQFENINEIMSVYSLERYDINDEGLLPFFNKYGKSNITEYLMEIIFEFTEFLPKEILDTFIEIENK